MSSFNDSAKFLTIVVFTTIFMVVGVTLMDKIIEKSEPKGFSIGLSDGGVIPPEINGVLK